MVNGLIRYLSVSALTAYDLESYGGCPRRWWFRYVDGKKEPGKASTKLGEMVHAQLEHYQKTGEDVLGDIARAGMRFIPTPNPTKSWAEYQFGAVEGDRITSLLTAAGVPVVGKIDLVRWGDSVLCDDGEVMQTGPIVEVIDYKTTKQIDTIVDELGRERRGYAKTPDDMANTWQMTGYGEVALATASVRSLALSHLYFQTKGPRDARKVMVIMDRQVNAARWVKATPLVEQMKATAQCAKAVDVKANYDACGAYGGCPHREYCPREAGQVLVQLFGRKGDRTMGLLDKMRNEKAALIAEEREVGIMAPDAPAPKAIAEPLDEGVAAPPAAREASDKLAAREIASTKRRKKATSKEVVSTPKDSVSTPKDSVSAADGFDLYLGTSEDGVSLTRLEPYVEALCDQIAAEAGELDVRSAGDGPLAFGKWKGILASHARQNPPPPGSYAVDMSCELSSVVATALRSKARRVVRAA